MNQQNPHSVLYSPPGPKEVSRLQNTRPALRLLLAQRRLYSTAKRWAFFRVIGICGIAVAAPIVTAARPQTAVIVGGVAALWVFLARTVFVSLERQRAARAAEIQEQFDTTVFGMPHLQLRDPRATHEEVFDLVGPDDKASDAITKERLQDWYPVPDDISGEDAIAIAQRSNAAYSERLLNANANIWLAVTAGWSLIALAVGVGLRLNMEQFLLGVGIPLLPALLDVWEQWRQIKVAGHERRAMADGIAKKIRRTDGASVTGEDLLIWQDQMYYLRRNTPQVPNLLYKRLRQRNERAMNSAAAELAEIARENLKRGVS